MVQTTNYKVNMGRISRANDGLRKVELIPNFSAHAEGSCLVKFGNTHVLCTASVDMEVPRWLKGTNKGWVTAEYGMLPRSTHERMQREAKKGQGGRTQEIQRLIARALRSVVNLRLIDERQIIVDCDVIQADGGTRTAAITGGYVALALALKKMRWEKALTDSVAAISCGILEKTPILDLEYTEDSKAEVDSNFVITGSGKLVEIQGTGENGTFSEEEFLAMMQLAKKGCAELTEMQKAAL
jgi:ribonuclease PH